MEGGWRGGGRARGAMRGELADGVRRRGLQLRDTSLPHPLRPSPPCFLLLPLTLFVPPPSFPPPSPHRLLHLSDHLLQLGVIQCGPARHTAAMAAAQV